VANKDHFIQTLETNLSQNKQQLEKVNQELTTELKKNQELTTKCQEINQLEQARLTLEAETTRLQQEIKELTEDHEKTKTGSLEQLRKINVLFDENANDYERIDFEGLYSLLEKISNNQQLTQQTLNQIDNYLENNF